MSLRLALTRVQNESRNLCRGRRRLLFPLENTVTEIEILDCGPPVETRKDFSYMINRIRPIAYCEFHLQTALV